MSALAHRVVAAFSSGRRERKDSNPDAFARQLQVKHSSHPSISVAWPLSTTSARYQRRFAAGQLLAAENAGRFWAAVENHRETVDGIAGDLCRRLAHELLSVLPKASACLLAAFRLLTPVEVRRVAFLWVVCWTTLERRSMLSETWSLPCRCRQLCGDRCCN